MLTSDYNDDLSVKRPTFVIGLNGTRDTIVVVFG